MQDPLPVGLLAPFQPANGLAWYDSAHFPDPYRLARDVAAGTACPTCLPVALAVRVPMPVGLHAPWPSLVHFGRVPFLLGAPKGTRRDHPCHACDRRHAFPVAPLHAVRVSAVKPCVALPVAGVHFLHVSLDVSPAQEGANPLWPFGPWGVAQTSSCAWIALACRWRSRAACLAWAKTVQGQWPRDRVWTLWVGCQGYA